MLADFMGWLKGTSPIDNKAWSQMNLNSALFHLYFYLPLLSLSVGTKENTGKLGRSQQTPKPCGFKGTLSQNIFSLKSCQIGHKKTP